jgi:hypothetical protein
MVEQFFDKCDVNTEFSVSQFNPEYCVFFQRQLVHILPNQWYS